MTYRVASFYKHEQSTPAAIWTIEHGVGGYPVVDVFVDVNGVPTKISPKAITYINPNVCTVTFSSNQTGFAIVS